MIPLYIVATACISVFFNIWSNPDSKRWAYEQGQILLSEAGRVRLSIETRTGYRLLLPPPYMPPLLERTTFDPGPFPLSRQVYVFRRLLDSPKAEFEAIFLPSTATVGLAILVIFAIISANVWLWSRLGKVRLKNFFRGIDRGEPLLPMFVVTSEPADAIDDLVPPLAALDLSNDQYNDFVGNELYLQDRQIDYADEIWNDRSFHVQDEFEDPVAWDADLALWEGEGDDWSTAKPTDAELPESHAPLRLPVQTGCRFSDEFNNLGPVLQEASVETKVVTSALPELRQSCRVYGDEEEARIARQTVIKRVIRDQLDKDPTSIERITNCRAPPFSASRSDSAPSGSRSVPSTPSNNNIPLVSVSTGSKTNRRRGGRWKRRLAATLAAEIESSETDGDKLLAELDWPQDGPDLEELMNAHGTAATSAGLSF